MWSKAKLTPENYLASADISQIIIANQPENMEFKAIAHI